MISMGYSEDIMQRFVMKDLRMKFPESEGWQESRIASEVQNREMYIFSRRNRGQSEKAVAMVSFDQKIAPAALDDLVKKCDSTPQCTKRIMLVPQSTSLKVVPPDVQVLTMSAFGFEAGKLTWLTKKRNVKMYPSEGLPMKS